MYNKKTTSKSVAAKAAQILSAPKASSIAKRLAGSALSQTNKKNQTGSEMEQLASKVLASKKYSNLTKEFAGSVLSQSVRKL